METLLEIPGNPVPERASAGFFTTLDGKKLRYALVKATGRPMKGTVVLMQGRNECLEKYFETANDLSKRGFGVAMFDWRGQGGSDRMLRDPAKGYVRSFDDHVRDLDRFFEHIVLPDCRAPFYILAHSAGALAVLAGAPAMINRVRRMVLVAPFLELADSRIGMRGARRLATLLCWLGLGRFYASRGTRPGESIPFPINQVTTDPKRYARNVLLYKTYPRLALGGPTVRWMKAATDAALAVREPAFMARIQVPILFVAAGDDEVVSTPAVESYARGLRSGSVLTIDGARHEILQEADIFREQLLAAFETFVPGTDMALA